MVPLRAACATPASSAAAMYIAKIGITAPFIVMLTLTLSTIFFASAYS